MRCNVQRSPTAVTHPSDLWCELLIKSDRNQMSSWLTELSGKPESKPDFPYSPTLKTHTHVHNHHATSTPLLPLPEEHTPSIMYSRTFFLKHFQNLYTLTTRCRHASSCFQFRGDATPHHPKLAFMFRFWMPKWARCRSPAHSILHRNWRFMK